MFLVDENYPDSAFRIRFFGDAPCVANPLWAVAVHATPCIGARKFESLVTHRI